jgi:hypothetical protein
MQDVWIPIFALPNVELANAIDGELVSLVPAHDFRIRELKRSHPRFRRFLNRFSDNFGEKFEPAVFLLHKGALERFSRSISLVSFRDLIAISAITFGRSHKLIDPRKNPIVFGETFQIYPWMIDTNFEDMVGVTPAFMGIHDLSKFKGQSSPALMRNYLSAADLDQELFADLLLRWSRYAASSKPDWKDSALFRSLNMAYHASLLPAGTEVIFYDVGRLVSLWVSAFEILVHPGGGGRATTAKVIEELIERVPWQINESSRASYLINERDVKGNKTLASFIYSSLYQLRNNFLHGNPIDREDLYMPGSEDRTWFQYAAPLYKLALTSFLQDAASSNSMENVEVAEEALLTAIPHLSGRDDAI